MDELHAVYQPVEQWSCTHCYRWFGRGDQAEPFTSEIGARRCSWHPSVDPTTQICQACGLDTGDIHALPPLLQRGCTRCDHCPPLLWYSVASGQEKLLAFPAYTQTRHHEKMPKNSAFTYAQETDALARQHPLFVMSLPKRTREKLETRFQERERFEALHQQVQQLARVSTWLPAQPLPEAPPPVRAKTEQELMMELDRSHVALHFTYASRRLSAEEREEYQRWAQRRSALQKELAHEKVEWQYQYLSDTAPDPIFLQQCQYWQ